MDLTLIGFKLQSERVPDKRQWTTIESIPFKDLAKDVEFYPEGDDALDLTRCIRHTADYPDEDWNYPVDFERLTERLGGPAKMRPEHCHSAANHRWETWHRHDHDEREWFPEDDDTESDSDTESSSSDNDVETFPEQSTKVDVTAGRLGVTFQADKAVHAAQICALDRQVLRSAQGRHDFLSLKEDSHLPVDSRRRTIVPKSLLERMVAPQADEAHLVGGNAFAPPSAAVTRVTYDVHAQQTQATTDHEADSAIIKPKLLRDHNDIWKAYPLDRMFAIEKKRAYDAEHDFHASGSNERCRMR